MSRIALGTAAFGFAYGIANRAGKVAQDAAGEILRYASGHGICMLDTAIAYGDSESVLGKAGITGWGVVTKLPAFGTVRSDAASWVRASIRESAERLRVPRLHAMLLHRAEDLLENAGAEIYATLSECKEKGLTKKIGVSIYDPSALEEILSLYPVDIVQAPFNVLDRRLEKSGWLERLHERGVEVHARSAFLQGLLLMKSCEMPARFARWNDIWTEWTNWLHDQKTCARDACLQFVLNHPQINKVVVGINSLEQLREIVASEHASGPQPPASLACSDIDLINPTKWVSL